MGIMTAVGFPGLTVISVFDLPANVTAAFLAPTPPAGVVSATVTFRSPVTLTYDGITLPTAGAVGHDYPAGTYELTNSQTPLAQVRIIGGSTGYVTLWGLRT